MSWITKPKPHRVILGIVIYVFDKKIIIIINNEPPETLNIMNDWIIILIIITLKIISYLQENKSNYEKSTIYLENTEL